jgi:hypothetical protein
VNRCFAGNALPLLEATVRASENGQVLVQASLSGPPPLGLTLLSLVLSLQSDHLDAALYSHLPQTGVRTRGGV